MRERIVAAMPLISLALFLTSGLVWERWGLGVSFFLLIPLSTLILTKKPLKKLNQLMPLIALTLFLWLWLGFDLAHPGWVVFLLIPLANIVLNPRADARTAVTFLVSVAYVVLGLTIDGFWHPGWLIFFLIPIVNIIFFPTKKSKYRRGGRYFHHALAEFMSDVSGYSAPFRDGEGTREAYEGEKDTVDDDGETVDVKVDIR